MIPAIKVEKKLKMNFKTWIVLIIIKIVSMRTGFASVQKKYSLQINTSLKISSINSTYLIKTYKLRSKMMCLAQCTLIENCISAQYNQNSIVNCFLYSKYFASSELKILKNSLFYSKECKP